MGFGLDGQGCLDFLHSVVDGNEDYGQIDE